MSGLSARLEGGPFHGHLDAIARAPEYVTVIDCPGCHVRHVVPVDPDRPTERAIYALDDISDANVARYVYLGPTLDPGLAVESGHPAVHPRCRSSFTFLDS
jgi:hypothetical protein